MEQAQAGTQRLITGTTQDLPAQAVTQRLLNWNALSHHINRTGAGRCPASLRVLSIKAL